MLIRRRFPLLLALLLAAGIVSQSAARGNGAPVPRDFNPRPVRSTQGLDSYVPGQILVRLRNNVSLARVGGTTLQGFQTHFQQAKIGAVKSLSSGAYRLDVAKDADVIALARQLAADPVIAYAEPNYRR